MADQAKCGACLYAQEIEEQGKVECRRESPRPILLPTPGGPMVVSPFPPMDAEHGWCGEYKAGTMRARPRIDVVQALPKGAK